MIADIIVSIAIRIIRVSCVVPVLSSRLVKLEVSADCRPWNSEVEGNAVQVSGLGFRLVTRLSGVA